MSAPNQSAVDECVQTFGRDLVATVLLLCDLSDPDGAYSYFEDMQMHEHAECVRAIYFDE
jgi:hypothetical protein